MVKLHRDRPAAEDVVHKTFEVLIDKPGDYDPQKGHFVAYLYGIALNKVRDHFRDTGKYVPVDDPDDPDGTDTPLVGTCPEDQGDLLDKKIRQMALMRCMDKLPSDQRDTMICGWLKEMIYTDVAKMLDTEVGTVKSRVHIAMKRLRDCLERQLGARVRK